MADLLFRTLVRFFDAWIEPVVTEIKASSSSTRGRSELAPRVFRSLAVVAALSSAACSSSFGAGVRAYEHGRYPEALEAFAAAETPALRDNDVESVRYALYRGLTHLALGDLSAAFFWLERVKRALDANPALLPAAEAGRLSSAWAHLPLESTHIEERNEPCLSTLR